ncbi:MAG: DUF2059 domain-containing protein [Phenylobacterium sp.]|uniref:DUF2059 domain-containing protein n=1 Tax=Phenylobacterium sp. TaxID=1871053 RepID=UPI0039190FD8
MTAKGTGAMRAMWRRTAAAGLALMLAANPVIAPAQESIPAETDALVRRLFAAQDLEGQIRKMFVPLAPMFGRAAAADVPDSEPLLREAIAETVAEVVEQVLVPRMMEEAVPVYASVFTREELEAIAAFYESAAGRAMLAKQPQVEQAWAPRMMELRPLLEKELRERACAKIDCNAAIKAKPRSTR